MTRRDAIRLGLLVLLLVVLLVLVTPWLGLTDWLQGPVLILVLVFGAVLLLVKVFQLCWNYSICFVFGAKEIDYWQAFGLLIVARLLFGWSG